MKKLYKYIILDKNYTRVKGEVYITKVTDRHEITEEDIKREIIHQIFHDDKNCTVILLKEIPTIRVNHIPKI